ncbi:MAG: YeeE/YedE family protein, partial [Pelagibacteraceae bacterium]|nr:YeeE/YedE family protein [Pelagibacteraceae bacterium]
MSEKLFSLLSGIIFGVGLVISGMTNPEKVIGFLSITHNWDASLIFVMGGAILVFAPF